MGHLKKILWGLACLLCLVGCFVLWRGDRKTVETLTPQLSAARWETEEKPYAMASVFLEPVEAIAGHDIGAIYLRVENALTAAGVPSDRYPWFYAASYETEATLGCGASHTDVLLTAVDGEFFRMHPLPLRSGWYIHPDDLMHDRIVLDRKAAWDLFYSDNVAGQYVELSGVTLQVAAVVDIEPGALNELAAGDTRRAWVLSDCPALGDGEPRYTCLEMVMPQPVKQFATGTLRAALGDALDESTPVTDNSARFSLPNRWKILRSLRLRGIQDTAIAYPYWENAARLAENRLARRLLPEGALLLIPALSLLGLLLWLNHRRTWGLHSIRDALENAVDRKRQRDYDARLHGQEPKTLRSFVPNRNRREKAARYANRTKFRK